MPPTQSLAAVVARYRALNDSLVAAHPEYAIVDARLALQRGDTANALQHTLRVLDRILPR